MLRIGLTGGIGSGKTVVSDRFRELGVPVIDTDVIARELVTPGSEALNEIIKTFGDRILTREGKLDRKHLGKLVFADTREREKLEAILHPKILELALSRVEELDAPYCILVVPLLVETEFIEFVDKILLVDAPDNNRIKWIKGRSGLSETDIQNIMDAQTNREERLAAVDWVIDNDGTVNQLEAKVDALHKQIIWSLGPICRISDRE